MTLGQWLNENPIIAVGVAVVVLVIAAVIIMRSGPRGSGKPIEQRYYYDLQSGELQVMDNQPAPVTTESGSQAVWASVYACHDCGDPSDRFVVHLQKYTDQAKREAQKPRSEQDWDTVNEGTLIALPPESPGGDIKWTPLESQQGMAISQSMYQSRCPGMPEACQP